MKILIVDDHEQFRASARLLLEVEGHVVVGEASDGASGVALARELHPDVVLLDVGLPDISGYEVAEALATIAPKPAVVLVSNRGRAEISPRTERGAARGFIPKDELSADALRRLLDRQR